MPRTHTLQVCLLIVKLLISIYWHWFQGSRVKVNLVCKDYIRYGSVLKGSSVNNLGTDISFENGICGRKDLAGSCDQRIWPHGHNTSKYEFHTPTTLKNHPGPSWLWLYGSWIYYYLCNQCLSTLKLWVRTPFMGRCIWYYIL